jgi:CubicO group peptidase (beta-lactamase class C family)
VTGWQLPGDLGGRHSDGHCRRVADTLTACTPEADAMKHFTFAALLVVPAGVFAGQPLPRSTPEAEGVHSSAVLAFVEEADKELDSLHSFMLVRHGKVVAEGWWAPYTPQARHMLFSLSKSFTSTAVGLAAAEGKLSIDDPVLKFFPDDAPAEPTANLKGMRLSDLLRMSTGQQTEPARKPDEVWTKTFLHHPVPFKPGTHFLYNTSATYMLSAAVQKATGQTVLDFLKPRLFDPLGIDDPTWEKSPQGISTGGYGLSIRTEDIAKFGQLYLEKGEWQGRRLIPESWIAAATARQTSNGSNPKGDWDQGYGYQFWRCRHNAYRGDGAFGQYCIVMPDQDAVIAITSGLRDMQAVLNLAWDKLLPGFEAKELPAEDGAATKLQTKLKNLVLRLPEGTATPANVAGKMFTFPANDRKLESLTITNSDRADVNFALHLKVNGTDQTVNCGVGSWKRGRTAWFNQPEQPVAAAAAWTAADTLTVKVSLTETPFVHTVTLKFDGDKVSFQSSANVGFGPTKAEPLTGTASR